MAVLSKLAVRPAPHPLKVARIHYPLHARPLRCTVRAAAFPDASVPGGVSKTALRKLPKATLESKLSQLGLDATGNKNALVERLMEASQQTIAQQPAAASSQVEEAPEEVSSLRTEVTQLQMQLAATTEQLEAANAAAEAERRELGQMSSAMARLQAEHVEERAQLQTAEDAASKLQESCEETESLRTRQADLAERITLMQTLLEERDTEIDLLKKQLEEFVVRTTAYAAGGAAEGGCVAVAERPARADWDIPSAWRSAESTKPTSLSGGVPFVMEEGGHLHDQQPGAKQPDVTQKHGAPMMLALAGAQTVARAYMSVRRSLPKDYRKVMDTTAVAVGSALFTLAAYG
ncbi:g5305 [Coccomyxa viridis]|uniref:G5305 protein n=1 Tax=Coccomyxa viridis TaxID=1274662 RepID=A0ABP1FSH6_9CHLO